MTILEKQWKFVQMISLLILYAYQKGYTMSFGDAFRYEDCPYGNPESLHKIRLAVDLNLFKDGVYLTSTEDHLFLGEFWESLDPECAWGGRWGDGNHYSYKHEGKK